MIIECPYCDTKVQGKVLAAKEYPHTDEGCDPCKITFLECPICGSCLVASQDLIQTGVQDWDWTDPSRLWPQPAARLHFSIPRLTRKSLEEAKKCFGAQAYAACAVMCGRAVEAICAEHKTQSKNLGDGLKELRSKEVIDKRLYEWGDALREQRNIGAHANEEDISREDASDVLDFAIAICEYVFVLSEKYSDFRARQNKKTATKIAAAKAPLLPPPSLPTAPPSI